MDQFQSNIDRVETAGVAFPLISPHFLGSHWLVLVNSVFLSPWLLAEGILLRRTIRNTLYAPPNFSREKNRKDGAVDNRLRDVASFSFFVSSLYSPLFCVSLLVPCPYNFAKQSSFFVVVRRWSSTGRQHGRWPADLESREKEGTAGDAEASIRSPSEKTERDPPFVREICKCSRPNQTDRQTHHGGLRKFCFYRLLVSDRGFARKRKTARPAGREDRSRSRCNPQFQLRIAK